MRRAFSILELLAVMAIIAVMVGLLVPVIGGFAGPAGRKGAVTTVMNTLEQARVAAIEAGRPTHVIFWRPEHPEQDAILVLREAEDPGADYEQLSRWLKLPQRVLLHDPPAGGSVFRPASELDTNRLPEHLRSVPISQISNVTFNESGAVAFPSTANLFLRITEGIRGQGGTEARTINGFDMISIARFSGRTQLEFSLE